MFDINKWLSEIEEKIKDKFKENVLFIGYQGSYKRNEANENSDIDMVVILDSLGLKELKNYKEIVQSMEYKEKACGFICGKNELQNWSKYELFQLYNDTKPLFNDLKKLLPEITKKDAEEALKIGVENLYHFTCHSFLYSEDSAQSLKEILKGIFFVLQAEYYCKHGVYIDTRKKLSQKLEGEGKKLLLISMNREEIKNHSREQKEEYFETLISYCKERISKNSL